MSTSVDKLNADIKNLLKLEKEKNLVKLKSEFERLYKYDEKFNFMSKKSIRIMLKLNLVYRIIPLHEFGLSISFD